MYLQLATTIESRQPIAIAALATEIPSPSLGQLSWPSAHLMILAKFTPMLRVLSTIINDSSWPVAQGPSREYV